MKGVPELFETLREGMGDRRREALKDTMGASEGFSPPCPHKTSWGGGSQRTLCRGEEKCLQGKNQEDDSSATSKESQREGA